MSNYKLFDLWTLDLTKSNGEKCESKGFKPSGRYSHIMCHFRGSLYIFGGCFSRENGDDSLLIYNIEKKSFKPQRKTHLYKDRLNHVAGNVGYHMIVYGGINECNQYLNDISVFDMQTLVWVERFENTKAPALAYSASCVVISKEKMELLNELKSFGAFEVPEVVKIQERERRRTKVIKYEGVYIFGGKTEDGDYSSKLGVIRIGRYPLEYSELQCTGKPPSPRINCSIDYYDNFNLLIVHGGRHKADFCLTDIFLFDLENLRWMNLDIKNTNVFPRCEHISALAHNRLIIFGGIGEQQFLDTQLFNISLDLSENGKYDTLFSEWKLPKNNFNSAKNLPYLRQTSRKRNTFSDINIEDNQKKNYKYQTSYAIPFVSEFERN